MNQPASRCHGWVDNLIQIGELLDTESNIGNPDSPPPESVAQAYGDCDSPARGSLELHDEDEPGDPYQGTVEEFPGAAAIYSRQQNSFLERFDRDQFSQERRVNLYYPFASRADWEMGLWLTRSGLSMAATDSLLSLDLVSLHFFFLSICWIRQMSSDEDSPPFIPDSSSVA